MKKALILSLAVLLFFACKQDNLFPDYDADLPTTGAGNFPHVVSVSPNNRGQIFDDNPDTSDIQASVTVTFSDYMDWATLTGNVKVINTTTGGEVQSIVVTYNAEARKAYIRSDGWASGSAYLLTLSAGADGIKNRFGTALDGDRDTIYDGSPYDDYLTTFYTSGSASDSCVAIIAPRVISINPDTERVFIPQPEITINFSTAMDTTNLANYITNFKLFKGSIAGDPVPIDTAYCIPMSIRFKPRDSLLVGNTYFFVITSANVKAKYPNNTPAYLLPLDADYDGSEPTEPNFSWYFLYDTIAPPRVTNCEEIMNGVRIDFSTRMDQTTLTTENIKVFDSIGYVPGSFVIVNESSDYHTTTVEYYFERTAYSPSKVFVSKNVKSTKGRMLDSNDNGIGGEDKDDCWYPL
jgi:hypothetical protein